MSRAALALVATALVVLFLFISQSIVVVKIMQLRILLSREQVLSYELSSKMLRARFRRMLLTQGDFSAEVKMNVLDSGIMNSQETAEEFELTPEQKLGLGIVNIVRRLSLKSPLDLQGDRNKMLLLQYAFYMERTRYYAKASEKYTTLEGFKNLTPEDHGFVLLHNAYCLTLMGNVTEAVEKLQTLLALYPGTHYSENAGVLLRILEEGRQAKKRINERYKTEEEKALALYKAGMYSNALEKFNSIENLGLAYRYYRARCREETGRTQDAVAEYMELVRQEEDPGVAKKANRRLLMIGSFYGGGKGLAKAAEDNAKRLGDEKVVTEVKAGVELQSKPAILETISKAAEEGEEVAADIDPEVLEQLEVLKEELKEELEETMAIQEEAVKEVVVSLKAEAKRPPPPEEKPEEEKAPPPKAVRKPRVAPPEDPPKHVRYDLYVQFVDGRRVYGSALEISGEVMTIRTRKLDVTLPHSMLARVGLVPVENVSAAAPEVREERIQLETADGTKLKAFAVRRTSQGGFAYENASGEESLEAGTLHKIAVSN